MLEYVFFHQRPSDLFIDFLKKNNLKATVAEKDGMFSIQITDEIERPLAEEIEVEYDKLMTLNQELFFEIH